MERREKSIDVIIPPPHFHMVGDGFRVHNFSPSQAKIGMTGMSPFFLSAEIKQAYEDYKNGKFGYLED